MNNNNIFIDLTEELYSKGWTVHWEFNSDIDPALLKYNNCVDYAACRAINPDVANDIDGNGAWNYRLDNLEIGGYYNSDTTPVETDGLFAESEELKSFNVDLPKLTDGISMFGVCQNLTSFSSDLSSLTYGLYMFLGCTRLTSFSSDLPKLTDGNMMFASCESLISFSSDLSSLTDGWGMFGSCTNLTSFSSDLSNLTIGLAMFGGCTNLTSFSSDLPKLTSGLAMLSDCKLDLKSVQNIANTINDLSDDTSNGNIDWGRISIGIHASLLDDADLEIALAAIRAKRWIVDEQYN